MNTTANNLANVDTEGYVRQQVLFSDKEYNTFGTACLLYTSKNTDDIIPYQEIIGNYSIKIIHQNVCEIIPYQEIIAIKVVLSFL